MSPKNREIAIIGVACRYPGSSNARAFWENVLASRRQFRRIPECRVPLSDYGDKKATDKTYATQAAVMDIPKLDWAAHRIPKSSYEGTDAVHWLAYQVAIEAAKDAGYTRESMPRRKTGVLLGNTLCGEETRSLGIRLRWPFLARSFREATRRAGVADKAAEHMIAEAEHLVKSVFPALSEDSLAGAMSNTIAGRIASYFDLDGGGYVVDGAGASSLLAVAVAAGKLEVGDLDLAVVGGVDLSIDPLELVGYSGSGQLTPNMMTVFDRRSSGFILGEGCGMAILKRRADAERDGDFIYAVIRGCGISSDGRSQLNEPDPLGLQKAIERAHVEAGYSPRTLHFIEGSGAGTPTGDRAELEAVHRVLRGGPAEERADCGLTALTALLGNTKGAAGIGSLIKTVIALNRRVLPPLAAHGRPHPFFEVTRGTLRPLLRGEIRPADAILRAGVSSMALGGLNCHITLESGDPPRPELAPALSERTLLFSAQDTELFLFSGATQAELAARLQAVRPDAAAASLAELTDLAAELATTVERNPGRYRAAIVAHAPDALVLGIEHALEVIAESEAEGETLEHATLDRRIWLGGPVAEGGTLRVACVFPDARAEAIEIGRALVERHAALREVIEQADLALTRRGRPALSPLLFAERPALDDDEQARRREALAASGLIAPAVAITSVLWARYLKQLGIEPAAAEGFGLGARIAAAWEAPIDEIIEAALADEAALLEDESELSALVEGLADRCEILLEVGGGPGLSRRLVEAIGTDAVRELKTPCLPLESSAGNDRDLGCALGALFTRGLDLAWSRTFEGRLVNPFVPAKAQNFFRNPCERPFPEATHSKSAFGPALLELPGTEGLGLSAQALEQYIERHGDVVAEMIRADLKQLARSSALELPPTFIAEPAAARRVSATDEAQAAEGAAAAGGSAGGDIAGKIVELICERTGYPESSVSLESRLLDDLNLDSIKAAEIVGTTAQAFGAGGQLDASMFANASIQEIAGAIRLALQSDGQVIDVTGHDGSVRVMNLGELSDPPWVRNFAAGVLEVSELPADQDGLQREDEDWASAVVLILTDNEDSDPHARALTRVLSGLGATVSIWPYSAESALERGRFSHTFALLPRNSEGSAEALERSIRRLHAAVSVSSGPNRLPRKKVNAVIFLQFGGGDFAGLARSAPFEDAGLVSFAASVHLERGRQRVRVVDAAPSLAPEAWAAQVVREVEASDAWAAAGYDAEGVRRVPRVKLQDRSTYSPRNIPWSERDVVVATGAARGITAECAMAFARATGVRLAIFGSTALVPGSDSPSQAEIERNLERLKEDGITARYYTCDVTDLESVRATCERVRTELGAITGVIHGAGLNVPKLAEQLSEADALRQVKPKVLGAAHLMQVLEAQPPKLFAALTSIIGVSGMHGNAWYAYANEVTDLLLRGFEAKTGAKGLAVAYGIWAEVGMGARLGAVAAVEKAGTAAIPPVEGATRFAELMLADPGCRQVVVTGRLAPIDTWATVAPPAPSARFIERVLRAEPGVDLIARTDLSLERDPYLPDHTWNGSALFPAVFGIEAMAQAVARATGRADLGARLTMESLTFHRPIIVHPVYGAEIQVSALVAERAPGEPIRVHARITSKQLAFKTDCFSAVFVLDDPAAPTAPKMPEETPANTDARPEDYYGSKLFHGPAFRRITELRELARERIRFISEFDVEKAERAAASPVTIGDPFFLDTLLHGLVLGDLEGTSLPTRIERVVLDGNAKKKACAARVFAALADRGNGEYRGHATAFDGEGHPFVLFEGIWMKTIEHRASPGSNSAQDGASAGDEATVRAALLAAAEALEVSAPPALGLEPIPGIHGLERAERRQKTLPLLQRVATTAAGHALDITWAESGKVMTTEAETDISLSHDDDISIAVAGPGPQGCDVAPIEERRLEDWISILGNRRRAVLEALTADEPASVAGARVFAAIEAARKGQNHAHHLEIRARKGDAVLLAAAEAPGGAALTALTFPVKLGRHHKMFAVLVPNGDQATAPVVELEARAPSAAPAETRVSPPRPASRAGTTEATAPRYVLEEGADGRSRPVLLLRVPAATRGQNGSSPVLDLARALELADPVRDLFMRSIRGVLARERSQGLGALLSRSVDVEVFGEIEAGDVLEGAARLTSRGGVFDAKFDIVVDWRRVDSSGASEPVARTITETAWGRSDGRTTELTHPPAALSELLDMIATREPAARMSQENATWGPLSAVLSEREVEAELDEVGPSGGVTSERFARWMTAQRNALLTGTAVQLGAARGELRSLGARIEHLREAQAYEPIRVEMRAQLLGGERVRLHFEYFRALGHEGREPLVRATWDLEWSQVEGGRRVTSPMPETILDRLTDHGAPARADRADSTVLAPVS